MAKLYGVPEHEHERPVFELMKYLPKDCLIFVETELVGKKGPCKPDFIIIRPSWGVIILEQKGWVSFEEYGKQGVIINGEHKGNPVSQARYAAIALNDMISRERHSLKLSSDFQPVWAYGGILPNLSNHDFNLLKNEWGEKMLIGRRDLKPDRLTDAIERIPTRVPRPNLPLSALHFDILRAIIDPSVMKPNPRAGTLVIYDVEQVDTAREPLPEKQVEVPVEIMQPELLPDPKARMNYIGASIPNEIHATTRAEQVRLVRGFAGTGKTDVLILRTQYLYDTYPDIQILVTTFNQLLAETRLQPELEHLNDRVDVLRFNQLCQQIYHKHTNKFANPQETAGLLVNMLQRDAWDEDYSVDFLAKEFVWMKETGRTTRKSYVKRVRDGRGESRSLSQQQKSAVFDVFERYQARLEDINALDWVDLQNKALLFLEARGIQPDKQYDVVLIDEAQHFAPGWIQIIKYFLKPEGSLFICDDPSQSVYRRYSWRQKGVNVVGRTRWLRVPYRNTRQVFEAAYSLIENDKRAQVLSDEAGHVLPELEHEALRQGPRPEINIFNNPDAECAFYVEQARTLIQLGVRPQDIVVLHTDKYVRRRFENAMPIGVKIYENRRQTGMEYEVVFLPSIESMMSYDEHISLAEYESQERALFYMLMTRARTWLYLSHLGELPRPLRPMLEYVAMNGVTS